MGASTLPTEASMMTGMDERAAAIEADLGDPDAWGEAEPAPPKRGKSERRQRGVVVSVRLTPAEFTTVSAHAVARGMPVSALLRTTALEAAAYPVVPRRWLGPLVATNGPSSSVPTNTSLRPRAL